MVLIQFILFAGLIAGSAIQLVFPFLTQAIIVLTIAASEAIRASRERKKVKAQTVAKVEEKHEPDSDKSAQMEGVVA